MKPISLRDPFSWNAQDTYSSANTAAPAPEAPAPAVPSPTPVGAPRTPDPEGDALPGIEVVGGCALHGAGGVPLVWPLLVALLVSSMATRRRLR